MPSTKEETMKILGLFLTLFLFTLPAYADPAFITESGHISMTGEIDYVSSASNDFTLLVDDEEIEVSIDQINEETLDQLIDTDLIDSGTYVTVTGELEDGISGPTIKASSIRILGNQNDYIY
jgi:hypothetical protein